MHYDAYQSTNPTFVLKPNLGEKIWATNRTTLLPLSFGLCSPQRLFLFIRLHFFRSDGMLCVCYAGYFYFLLTSHLKACACSRSRAKTDRSLTKPFGLHLYITLWTWSLEYWRKAVQAYTRHHWTLIMLGPSIYLQRVLLDHVFRCRNALVGLRSFDRRASHSRCHQIEFL